MVNLKHIGWWLYRVITPWVRSCNGLIFRILKTDGMTITHMTYVIWPWHIWNIPVIYSRRWNIPISIWNTPYTVYIIQLYYVILYILVYIYIYTYTYVYKIGSWWSNSLSQATAGNTNALRCMQRLKAFLKSVDLWGKNPSDPRFFAELGSKSFFASDQIQVFLGS